MADRENVPYAGEVEPRSDTDNDNDETAHPISTFQHSHFNSISSNGGSEDGYCRYWNIMNEGGQLRRMFEFAGGENEDDYSDIIENVLKSSENGNKNDELFDIIKYLSLSDDNVCDTTKKDDEKNTISEDENTEEVEREDNEENDDTTEERNSFVRFLELSNLFIRNIMRKAYDFTRRTPRE